MKKLCLYFFSGTGMTKYVIDKFISEFNKRGVSVDFYKIEDAHNRNVDLSQYDALGVAYPVHSFKIHSCV